MGNGNAGPPDVIFDLDGVLATRDTFTALLVRRLTRAPFRLVLCLPALVAWVASRGDRERHVAAARRVAAGALRGLDEAGYDRFARQLGARFGGDATWVRGEVVALLGRFRLAGHRIVVTTASERRLAESFLQAVGAEVDLLVASEIGWSGADPHLVAHRRGADKLAALREAGVDLPRALFYTDSFDDEATAAAAGEVVLVHPSESSLRRYRASGLRFRILNTGADT